MGFNSGFKGLILATASIVTTIFNSLVIEKKTCYRGILNCNVMVSLPLIATGTVGNILTKSKGHSLYFRAFTVRSILGEKLKIYTKFRLYETFQVNNQRFNEIENWAGSSAPFLCGVRKTSIVAFIYYLLFPALYLASRPLLPEGRAGIAWDHQSSKFSVPPSNRYSASRHTLLLPPPPLPSHLLLPPPHYLPFLCTLQKARDYHMSAASSADCKLYG